MFITGENWKAGGDKIAADGARNLTDGRQEIQATRWGKANVVPCRQEEVDWSRLDGGVGRCGPSCMGALTWLSLDG
jgi:hypothetical protein